ncbi:MAG: hypothetical protein HGGPFJEG_03057 [Ignavibacteria bacterium]|nr:hypothetical protein [Ignavibacteria bacterium]
MLDKIFSMFKEKTAPSKVPVDGKIHYKFKCGFIAWQEELNLQQDEELAKVLLNINIAYLNENSDIKSLLGLLMQEKILNKVLNIILISNDCSEVNYDLLKNSELEVVFKDFFSLNPTAMKLLKNTVGEAISKQKTLFT